MFKKIWRNLNLSKKFKYLNNLNNPKGIRKKGNKKILKNN